MHGHNDFTWRLQIPLLHGSRGASSVNTTLLGIGDVAVTRRWKVCVFICTTAWNRKNMRLEVLNQVAEYFVWNSATPYPTVSLVGTDFNTTNDGNSRRRIAQDPEIYNSFNTQKF
jgi:isopropylmalate/homocitrate/citramalate synthase